MAAAQLASRGLAAAALCMAIALAGCGGGSTPRRAASAPTAGAAASRGLHVSGNRLLDRHGRPVLLHGVNRSGTEYACVQGAGISDGPMGAASVRAMASWHVNAVRVPLNAHCWLGINGVERRYGGARYRRAIVRYANLLNHHGMYVELALMWSAPGTYRATYQPGGPDADHAPAFWHSLARTFRRHRDVILAPWGETIVNAGCFLHGGTCEATFGPHNRPYRIAGMQQAVSVMRGAGYRGVIAIPGVAYANDLSAWLSHQPRDPLHQLVAEAHVYGGTTCSSRSCFDRTVAPVAQRVPVIFGETGNSFDDSDCGAGNVSDFLSWADAHRVGYLAWTWDTWGTCGSLIDDFRGTPRGAYGRFIREHYAQQAGAARRIPAGS
jgi:hypothetical protein